MSITLFTKPKAVVTIIFALIFLFNANILLSFMGIDLSDGGLMMVRILGGVYFATGISFWQIESSKDISVMSAYLYGLGEIIAAVICFEAILSGVMNNVGLVLAVGYLLFACGFIWVAKRVNQDNTEGQ